MSTYSITNFQYGDSDLKGYLSQIRNYPMLTEEEEIVLTRKVYESQDRASAEKLVMSHMKLVVKIAYEMRRYGSVLIDLIGEGSIGLINAVKKYNPNIGVRFSGYAKLWIKAYIHEYIIKTWSLVRIGTTVGQKKLFFHLKQIKNKILRSHDSTHLSNEDCRTIANKLSVSSKEVKEMDVRLNGETSLDIEINSDSDNSTTRLSQLEDSSQDTELSVSKSRENNAQKALLENGIKMLPVREADIIRARHFSERPITLRSLAKKHNVSAERIRQIESSALQKVKEYCLANY